jgi:uncharacterized protein (DUF305 family)
VVALTAMAVVIVVVIATAYFVIDHRSDANAEAPGAVDIGFSQDMAVHHEQAVLMGNLALIRGSREIRSLADAIVVNQSQEIGLTRGWLKLWHEPAVDPHPMAWMSGEMPASMAAGMKHDGTTTMPGMASPDELRRLYLRTGRKFDVLFLQLMIRHHLGGIQMAKVAADHGTLPVIREAARSMIVEQVEDLGSMRAYLKVDGGKELPAP